MYPWTSRFRAVEPHLIKGSEDQTICIVSAQEGGSMAALRFEERSARRLYSFAKPSKTPFPLILKYFVAT